jgi:hypothetical protein
MTLRLAEQYVDRLGQILGQASAQVLPERLAELRGLADLIGLAPAGAIPLEPAPERRREPELARSAREGGRS